MNAPNPLPPIPAPVTAGAAPVWKSNVQVSLAVAFITGVAAIFPKAEIVAKFDLIDPVKAEGYVNLALMGMSLISVVGASAFRYFSKLAPQVLSWAAAMKHPATKAVIQTQAAMAQAGIPPTVVTQARIEAGQAATAAHEASNASAPVNISPEIIRAIATITAKTVVAELAAAHAEAKRQAAAEKAP